MKLQPKQYQAIIFDLGGVILNLDYNLTIQAFKDLGIVDFEHNYLQAKQDAVFDRYEKGKVTSAEFRNYFREKTSTVLSDSEIDAAWNKMLLDLPQHRIQFLDKVKTSCPIFLFSNTNAIHLNAFQTIIENQHGKSNLLEELFNKTYYSHIVGERKPNAHAFEIVLQEQNLDPSKVLFIDDSKQHIDGANLLGIKTYHLIKEDVTEIFELN